MRRHFKNGMPSRREGANLQGVVPKSSRPGATTHLNPHKVEGKSKSVQWNYFLHWSMVSHGNNSLYEKGVFQKAGFEQHTTCEIVVLEKNSNKML